MAWLQLGVHVVFMIGDQVDRLWGRDFYKNTRGHVPAVNRVPPEQRIAVPTVHAWSAKDIQYPGMAKQVMHMCCEESRVGVKHSAGHGVPTQGDEVAALAKAVMEMLEGLE